MWLHSSQYLHVTHKLTTTQSTIETAGGSMLAGATHHVAIVVMSQVFSVWVDGGLVGQADVPDTEVGTMMNTPIYVSDPWYDAALVDRLFPPTFRTPLARMTGELSFGAANALKAL